MSASAAGHEMTIRVRYCETDAMGIVHHGTYIDYFEMGRTELFRSHGGSYREFESRGLFFVVVSLECKYKLPAKYDDVLTLHTRQSRMTPAKLEHEYQITRGSDTIVTGKTVLACINQQGTVQRLSEELLFGDQRSEPEASADVS
ncbi:MAG: acyl-CoA thioesterase [Planctomycetaceae bacterium]|nr:acyl-CoA thioesterase [Planctomycetaceae bacterium]